MVGTLINAGAVVAGGIVGLAIHARLNKRMIDIVFQGIGLVTLGIGISMYLESKNMIFSVVSIVLGAIIGQWIDLDKHLRLCSEWLQNRGKIKTGKTTHPQTPESCENSETIAGTSRFTEGFLTASVLFCVGSLAILGPIEEGMGNEPKLLITKSVIDGISAIALASSFGVGVLFSAFPILIYQGSIALLAGLIMRVMTPVMIANMTGVGGLLLMGLGLSILKIKEINVTNMLPALVIVVILSYFF